MSWKWCHSQLACKFRSQQEFIKAKIMNDSVCYVHEIVSEKVWDLLLGHILVPASENTYLCCWFSVIHHVSLVLKSLWSLRFFSQRQCHFFYPVFVVESRIRKVIHKRVFRTYLMDVW